MKKLVALILAMVMILGLVSGCGKTANDTPDQPQQTDDPANSGEDTPLCRCGPPARDRLFRFHERWEKTGIFRRKPEGQGQSIG